LESDGDRVFVEMTNSIHGEEARKTDDIEETAAAVAGFLNGTASTAAP
jgi:hypothetical protein